MAVRLIVTITAAPGKGSELAQAYRARCAEISQEPGCEQFETWLWGRASFTYASLTLYRG